MMSFNELILGIIVFNIKDGRRSIWLPRAEVANFLIEERDARADGLSQSVKAILDLDNREIEEAVRSAIIFIASEDEDSPPLVCDVATKGRRLFINKEEAAFRRGLLKRTLTNQDSESIQVLAKKYGERAAVRRNG